MQNVRRVAIIGGNRIPFARSNSVYSSASNQEMLTATLQGLVDRASELSLISRKICRAFWTSTHR